MKLGLTVGASSVADILRAMDHRISPLDNWQVKIVNLTTPGTPDVEFTVVHSLGIVPTSYIWNVDRAAIVYDSRRGNWTITEMYLKCSVASTGLQLIVM